ncbi:hypothetical protein EOPP23_20015 [Endozoicomonas sp. OPT23]|uniref:vWA domain-containing protein n=1 Tax=Endozoicomonas sp. OPT23 TaxID=2072845 RepID=UPI00129BB8D8|nr:VWA domain-containing protein [Endozoicomonas sp. OPT23]MRI35259.1 hypothetical protein [Endozoicomonas sp. OPT23]
MTALFNEFITQFHFLRPLWLLALIPCAMLLLLLWKQRERTGSWNQVIAPELLKHLVQGFDNKPSRWPLRILFWGWFIAILALAGPSWQQVPTPVSKNQQPVVVLADMSYKMLAKDATPNRLARVRYKLLDLFKLRKDGLTALVAYAGSAHIIAPLTDDNKTLANLVPAMSPQIMPEQGDSPLAGIRQSIELLKQGSNGSGDILLITDSIPAPQLKAIKELLSESPVRLSIIGIGSDSGAPIALPNGGFLKDTSGTIIVPQRERSQLIDLANSTRGRYHDISLNDNDLKAVLPKPELTDNTVEVERHFDQWHDAGYWLVLLLLPLALAGFRKGWLMLALVMVLPSPQAEAFEWQDLWKNDNQLAMESLNSQRVDEAAQQFERNDWKGEALYRAEKYQEAAEAFAKSDTASGYYNQGNALAKANQLDDAIKAYDKALKLNPEMEDAKANKKLLEELKKQQQEQQQQDNQDKSQDKNQQNKDNQDQNKDQQNQSGQQDNKDQQQSDQKEADQNQSDENQQNQDQQQSNQNQSGDDQQDSQKDKEQQQSRSEQSAEDKQQEEKERQAAQQSEENKEQTDEQQSAASDQVEQQPMSPDQQAIENMLKSIPDNPGDFLKRKFQYQREQRQQQEKAW